MCKVGCDKVWRIVRVMSSKMGMDEVRGRDDEVEHEGDESGYVGKQNGREGVLRCKGDEGS